MPNAGGNTSSSKKGYNNLGGSSNFSHPIKHQNTSELLDDLKVDTPYGADYKPDMNFGLPLSGEIPENFDAETQGTKGWDKVNPGPGVVNRGAAKVSGSRDPEPGGGW